MIALTRSLESEVRSNRERIQGLISRGDRWDYCISTVMSYDITFEPLLKALGYTSLQELIFALRDPTVVDIMASTAVLAELFADHPSANKLGLAVSLTDQRGDFHNARDTQLNIAHIAGDISRGTTWRILDNQLNGRNPLVFLERAISGRDYTPQHPSFYLATANRMYRRLDRQGGLMLAELPSTWECEGMGMDISGWVADLNSAGIEAIFEPYVNFGVSGAIMIRKNPHSPEELPTGQSLLRHQLIYQPLAD